MHTFEELTGHEYMLHPQTCRIPVRTPTGEVLAETTLHVYFIDRELGRLEAQYIDAGAETVTLIGAAPVRLCDAPLLRRVTLEALRRDPWALVKPAGKRSWERMKAAGNLLEPAKG